MSHNASSVEIFDTTLRDGSQTAGINYSVEDKVRIAERLAEFGIGWIEGGWPGASPKDSEFFNHLRKRAWDKSKLIAFGSMARPGKPASEDIGLKHLIDSGADGACVFGKSWDLQGLGADPRVARKPHLELGALLPRDQRGVAEVVRLPLLYVCEARADSRLHGRLDGPA